MIKITLTVFLVLLSLKSTWSQKNLSVSLDEISKVTNNQEGALYFAGTRNINFRFSQRISPHGDCVDVVNGYAFVTWYKGGMDKRNLMLSRKNLKIANSPWITIEFPHKHVGQGGELLKGTGIRGDSHNTAAIGVSTIDNTIHIIYDLHAYSKNNLPNDFFNYSVSKKNMAFVPDSEFNLSIFNPKQTELKSGQNYERMTYPMIHRADNGSLIARYRRGGSGNGDILMAHYDGNTWSNNWIFQDGTLPLPNRNSMYGGERFINGKFYSGFSIRYANNNNSNPTNGYSFNSGLYFAYTNGIPRNQSSSQWFDVNDNPISLPIRNNLNKNLERVQIGEPGDDFGTETNPRTTSDPSWTVTESGAIHFITTVDRRNVHYYRGATDTNFSSNVGGLIPDPEVRGEIYSYKNHVFMVELISGKVTVKSTLEGQNDWKIVYSARETTRFNHFDAFVEGDKLYVYLMENTGNNTVGVGDSRPLFFQVFTLSEEGVNAPTEDSIVIEAEDFTTASEGVTVTENESASGGKIISTFRRRHFLEYKFQVNKPGLYDLNLFSANSNRDDATLDFVINDKEYPRVNVTRTFDWNVFKASTLSGVLLIQGENTIRFTQNTTLSSTPDRIQLDPQQVLSVIDNDLDNTILVYPNPSEGIFNIQSNGENIKYALINLQGQTLERGTVNQNKIDLSRFNSGVYFLELVINTKKVIKKIIIK